ncbi:MAG: hypothetical protein MJZ33_02915 [Paludibacteraceae bacterium]|nr:hypothetical protein [Paludibacteraceae bacterium]
MKILAIVVLLCSSVNLLANVGESCEIEVDVIDQMNNMGGDESSLLNQYESAYFNVIFKDSLKNFDFTGKNVAFIHRGAKSNKKEFFEMEKERRQEGLSRNHCVLYIFDEKQKQESGGYDACITFWCKIAMPKQEIIKKLQGKNTSKHGFFFWKK